MCGLFGAIGENIDNDILQETAAEAAKRGPQAHGISWLSGGGICQRKATTSINPSKAFAGIKSRAIIGNCRLSTSGSCKDTKNNQPIVLGDIAISHNGNVRSYLQIAEEIGADLKTQCDSEIICHLISRFGIQETLRRMEKEMPMALLLLQDNKIIAFRKGQPLYVYLSRGCFYFCSRRFRSAELLKEGKLFVFDSEGGKGIWK